MVKHQRQFGMNHLSSFIQGPISTKSPFRVDTSVLSPKSDQVSYQSNLGRSIMELPSIVVPTKPVNAIFKRLEKDPYSSNPISSVLDTHVSNGMTSAHNLVFEC